MNHRVRNIAIVLTVSLSSLSVQADSMSKLAKRAQEAARILQSNSEIPDNSIPTSLLDNAVCVATVPHIIRVGLVFGARAGKGLVSCRIPGGWSAPSYIKLKGGSWGLQIGVESIDLVLVFTRPSAVERFSKNNFTIGGEASVAAGPIGRNAQAGTDYQLDSEIYSYSRSRGLFAGLTIQGTSVTVDRKSNRKIYGADVNALDILSGSGGVVLREANPYVNALNTYAP